jgi:hypothetical protein
MADITTYRQFHWRRLMRGWQREMEERRARDGWGNPDRCPHEWQRHYAGMSDNVFWLCWECGATMEDPNSLHDALEGKTSDNLTLSSIRLTQRPWKPEDDDPETAA